MLSCIYYLDRSRKSRRTEHFLTYENARLPQFFNFEAITASKKFQKDLLLCCLPDIDWKYAANQRLSVSRIFRATKHNMLMFRTAASPVQWTSSRAIRVLHILLFSSQCLILVLVVKYCFTSTQFCDFARFFKFTSFSGRFVFCPLFDWFVFALFRLAFDQGCCNNSRCLNAGVAIL